MQDDWMGLGEAAGFFLEGTALEFFELMPEEDRLLMSPALSKMLGYHSSQEPACSYAGTARALFADSLRYDEFLSTLNEAGLVRGFVAELVKRDGGRIWVSIHAWSEKGGVRKEAHLRGLMMDISGQKMLEEQLRGSQACYRSLVENLNEVVFTLDLAGTVIYISPMIEEIFGYRPSDVIGKSFEVFIHPDDMPVARISFSNVLKGKREPYEFRMRDHWDRYRHVRTSSRIEMDGSGRPAGVTGLLSDITGMREAEERLLRSEELYRTVIDSASDGLILQDSSGRILAWNRAAERIFGVSAGDLLGRTDEGRDWRMIHEDGSVFPKADLPSYRTLRSGEPCRNVVAGVRNTITNQLSWININTSPLFKEEMGEKESRPYAAVISFSDITERKLAQDAAEEARSRLAAIIEFLPDATFVVDLHGRVMAWNRAMEEMTGIDESEMIGRGDHAYSIPFYGKRRQMLIDLLDAEDSEIARSYQHVRRRGGTIYVEALTPALHGGFGAHIWATGAQIFDATGKSLGAIESIRDISEKREAERRERLAREVLELLNQSGPSADFICEILRLIRRSTGIEAIGIRLREGGDYPYYHTQGLSEEFVCKERSLCAIDDCGEIRRDVHGDPILECLCGMVLTGRSDVLVPFFTEGGSLWSNDTKELGASIQGHSGPGRIRGRCIEEGYRSLALIPLKSSGKIIGLLQFNDRRSGRFNSQMISFFEDLGNIIGIALSRMKAEEAVRKEKDLAHMYLDIVETIIVSIGPDKRVIMINQAGCRLLGYREDEIVGRNWFENFLPERERAPALEVFGQLMEGIIEPHRYRERIVLTRGGEERIVAWHNAVMRDEVGVINGIISSGEDITERLRSEERLRESREYLDKIINTIGDPIFVKDRQHRFVLANDAMCILMGSSHEDLIGKNDYDFFPAEQVKVFLEKDELVFETGLENVNEEIITDSHGIDKTIITKKTIYTDNSGNRFIVGIIRDITELKQSIKRANELTEMARLANSAKSEFLANMSHEIRTPLNGVIGMTELLMDSELDEEQREYVRTVHASGEALLALLNDILDFSKIEARKLALEKRGFDLSTALKYTTDLLSRSAKEKGLELSCRVDEGVPMHLLGDSGRLSQILANLGGNAVKFTRQGRIEISIGVVERRENAVMLRFEVSDTGIGIPADRLGALFSPFTQVDGSTTRKYGGTGLGLAISRQLVEMMKGSIGVESREGEGSTFWFTAVFEILDRDAAMNVEVIDEKTGGETRAALVQGSFSLAGASGGGAASRPARILLAEDNSVNQKVAVAMLKRFGHITDVVTNGLEAVSALQKGGYDLVLMDCQMPEMDGFEATRSVRKMSGAVGKIPIVAMTASAMQADRERCLAAGMDDFIAKPVQPAQLSSALARWLKGPEDNATADDNSEKK